MRDDALYMDSVEDYNCDLFDVLVSKEKEKISQPSTRLSGFSFFITEEQLTRLPLHFISGSREMRLEIIKLIREKKYDLNTMGFQIQYSCKKCGFKSPEDALIDPLGMPELYICSRKECNSLFHRKRDKCNNVVNICPHCGNTNIEIYENHHCTLCPQRDNEELNIECIGTFF